MKKLFKTIALALFASTLSFANFDSTPNEGKSFDVGMYYDSNSGTIKTLIEKQAGDQLKVIFQDKDGNELTSTYANKKSEVSKVSFDINSLPNGQYSIKVTNGIEESIHPIEINQPKPVKSVRFSK